MTTYDVFDQFVSGTERSTGFADDVTFTIMRFTQTYDQLADPTVWVFPAAIDSAETFGAVTVLPTTILDPDGIASAETFGAVAVFESLSVYPVGIPSAETFGDVVVVSSLSCPTYDEPLWTYDEPAAVYDPPCPTGLPDGFVYLVAFNNQPFDDPSGISEVADGGVPGGAPPTVGAAGVWTNITQYVSKHTYSRGRQHELDRFEAGTATIDLVNHTGAFNPWNADGPFAGLLGPMRLMQIRYVHEGNFVYRYTGYIKSYPVQWPDEVTAYAQLGCVDAFQMFALADLTSASYAAEVLATTPGAYYRLGEITGPALDATGNGLDGAYQGSGTRNAAGAIISDLNGAFDAGNYVGYVQLPPGAGITGTGPFTVKGWVKLHAQPDAILTGMVYSQYAAFSVGYLFLTAIAGTGATCQLHAAASDGTNLFSVSTSSTALPIDGAYHQVALVRSGLGVTLYLDGVAAAADVSAPAAVDLGVLDTVSIAGSPGNPAGGNALNGAVDEVAIWGDRALTATQIAADFSAGTGQWPQQTTGARIDVVLDSIAWPAGARAIDAGATTVGAVTAALTSTKSLTYMQLVELTEDGALFMTREGFVRYFDRDSILTANASTEVATFGDNSAMTGGNEIPFLPGPDLVFDDLDIWNEVVVTRVNGQPQIAASISSQQAYGRRTRGLDGLLMTTDIEAMDRAAFDLDHYAVPVVRLRGLAVRPRGQPSTVGQVLEIELMNKVIVNRGYLPGGGTPFTQVALIERITENFDVQSGDWTVEFALSPTDAQTYWILEDPVYGILQSTTRLGY